MAKKLKQMKGKEFVDKILAGERDFSRIRLEERFDLSDYEGFGRLQSYLKKQDLSNEPILINGSKFLCIKAKELHLPYVEGRGANLNGADLREADLREADLGLANLNGADLREADLGLANLGKAYIIRADLREADLDGADLRGAYLGGADLRRASLRRADLDGADLGIAHLGGADLEGADLRNVKYLEHILDLGSATYFKTKVTQKEKMIIEEELKNRERFDVM